VMSYYKGGPLGQPNIMLGLWAAQYSIVPNDKSFLIFFQLTILPIAFDRKKIVCN